jgi:hypothetical protein
MPGLTWWSKNKGGDKDKADKDKPDKVTPTRDVVGSLEEGGFVVNVDTTPAKSTPKSKVKPG